MKKISKKKIRIAGIITISVIILIIIALPIVSRWRLSQNGISMLLKIRYLGDIQSGTRILLSAAIPAGFVEKVIFVDNLIYLKVFLRKSVVENVRFVKSHRTIFTTLTEGILRYRYIGLLLSEENYQDYERFQNNDEWFILDGMTLGTFMAELSSTLKEKQYEEKKQLGIDAIANKSKMLLANIQDFQNSNKREFQIIGENIKGFTNNFTLYFDSFVKNYESILGIIEEYSKLGEISITQATEFYNLTLSYASTILESIQKSKRGLGKFLGSDEIANNIKDILKYSEAFMKCVSKDPKVLIQVGSRCK